MLKRSRVSCKLLHMQLEIKKIHMKGGKKKVLYASQHQEKFCESSMYTKSHKTTRKLGFYYFCHSRDFLVGVVSQNSHKANSYLHFSFIFSCCKWLKTPVLSQWQMTQLTKIQLEHPTITKSFPQNWKLSEETKPSPRSPWRLWCHLGTKSPPALYET